MESALYSLYYQAHIVKSQAYLATSTFRYFSGISFDRCFNVEESIFEFFVAPGLEKEFCIILDVLQSHKAITSYQKLPNRLQHTYK